MQTSLDLIRFGAHFGKASISHPVLVICDQPATNPRLQGWSYPPTKAYEAIPSWPISLSNEWYPQRTLSTASIEVWCIILGAAAGETRTDPGIDQRDVSGVSSSRWMTRSWISGGGGLSCKWCQGGLWTMAESFALFDDQQATFIIQIYTNYIDMFPMFPSFFQLTFPTRLSFPENGPWHDRFSRSKGQSDVPKCDQWPPRQPPKEALMLTHLRASAPITTCCVHMLFYVDLKASGVRTSESTLVLSSHQNEDMSWNVYASNVNHRIFDIKHCNKS